MIVTVFASGDFSLASARVCKPSLTYNFNGKLDMTAKKDTIGWGRQEASKVGSFGSMWLLGAGTFHLLQGARPAVAEKEVEFGNE